jgi:iron(II)-dependent oxidoreductase
VRRLAVLLLPLAVLAPAGRARADGVMLVPRGPVTLGSDTERPEEAPRHRVWLEAFYIDRDKVSNAAFARFLDARGLASPAGEPYFDADDPDARIRRIAGPDGRPRWQPWPGFEDHPAVEVSWFGARDYCAWRGMRLPTEAEWEKAARGDDGRRYPWGDAPPTPAHAVWGHPYGATAPAGGRPAGASPHGLRDMAGNLREWTASRWRPYPYRPDDGRETPGPGPRVVRGASHDDPAVDLRVTIRRYYEGRGLARGHHHVGFRCATSEDLGGY